jgi:predicted Zn-dependent protease
MSDRIGEDGPNSRAMILQKAARQWSQGHEHGFHQGRSGDFTPLVHSDYTEDYKAGHHQGLTQARNAGALDKLGAGQPYGDKE